MMNARYRRLAMPGAALAAALFCVGAVYAQAWAFLGERTVRDRLDHDTIPVTVARGGFRRIKLRVRGRPVTFYRVQVRYSNGAPDIKPVRWVIPAGGETREIDLRGGDRAIRYIDFWYDAKALAGGRALVRAYGVR